MLVKGGLMRKRPKHFYSLIVSIESMNNDDIRFIIIFSIVYSSSSYQIPHGATVIYFLLLFFMQCTYLLGYAVLVR
jgi:hypothetical protein